MPEPVDPHEDFHEAIRNAAQNVLSARHYLASLQTEAVRLGLSPIAVSLAAAPAMYDLGSLEAEKVLGRPGARGRLSSSD